MISNCTKQSTEWHHESLLWQHWRHYYSDFSATGGTVQVDNTVIHYEEYWKPYLPMHRLWYLWMCLPNWMANLNTKELSVRLADDNRLWIVLPITLEMSCEQLPGWGVLRNHDWLTRLCTRLLESAPYLYMYCMKDNTREGLPDRYKVIYDWPLHMAIILRAKATIHIETTSQIHSCRMSTNMTTETSSNRSSIFTDVSGPQTLSRAISQVQVPAHMTV